MATPNYNIAPGESGQDIDFKRKLAYALLTRGGSGEPIGHWTQGLNRLAEGLIGGMDLNRLQKADESEKAQARELYASLLGGIQPPNATPVSGGPPPSAGGGQDTQPVTGPGAFATQIDAFGEIPHTPKNSPANRDAIIRTLYGEAASEPVAGKVGVANVIENRARLGGQDPTQVVTARNQFEPWNTPEGRQRMASLSPKSPQYQKLGEITDAVKAGLVSDPTGGATHFYAPKAQAALGRQPPSWAAGQTPTQIGAHNFYNPNSPQAQLPPGATPAQAPAQSPQQPPQTPSGPNPQMIAALMGNRMTAPLGQQIAGNIITDRLAAPKPTDDIREYNLYRQQTIEAGKTPMSFFDYHSGIKRAGSHQVTVPIDQRGELEFDKKAGAHQAERFDKVVQSGFDAKSLIADVQTLREIGGRITTGKQAEITAALGPYAEALGVKIDGLGDMQAYEAIVAKLAPRMRVVGSGATSDYEMRMFLQALPGLGKTPGGNELIMSTMDALSKHKEAAADIASRALSKDLKPSEAEKLLRDLPDPLALWKKNGKTFGGPAAPVSAELPRVTSPQEAARLPKGTRFISPDGKERIVP